MTTPPKRHTTITYSSHGLEPPVYVGAEFTTPPWEPLPMYVRDQRSDNGDLIFYRNYDLIPPGEYQYKFRLGDDWWVVDDSAPIVSDDAGNKNNLMTVDEEHKASVDLSSAPPKETTDRHVASGSAPPTRPSIVVEAVEDSPAHKGEATTDLKAAYEKAVDYTDPDEVLVSPDDEGPPLLPHEQRAQDKRDSIIGHARDEDELAAVGEGPLDSRVEEGPPLLPHEQLAVIDTAPLFPHESLHEDENPPLLPHESGGSQPASPLRRSSRSNSRVSRSMSVHAEAPDDENDPSLETFPTNREDIFKHIRLTEDRLDEDEAIDGSAMTPPEYSPTQMPRSPHSPQSPASLTRATSAVSIPMEAIVEEDVSETEDLPSGLAARPRGSKENHGLESMTDGTKDKADGPRSRRTSDAGRAASAAPPTPPMTPADLLEEARRTLRRTSTVSDTGMGSNDTSRQSLAEHDESSSNGGIQTNGEVKPGSSSEQEQDSREATEHTSSDMDSTANLTGAAPSKKDEGTGFLTLVWQKALANWMAPLGRWLGSICGGDRKGKGNKGVTVVITTAVAILALSAWLHRDADTRKILLRAVGADD